VETKGGKRGDGIKGMEYSGVRSRLMYTREVKSFS